MAVSCVNCGSYVHTAGKGKAGIKTRSENTAQLCSAHDSVSCFIDLYCRIWMTGANQTEVTFLHLFVIFVLRTNLCPSFSCTTPGSENMEQEMVILNLQKWTKEPFCKTLLYDRKGNILWQYRRKLTGTFFPVNKNFFSASNIREL